MSDRQNSSLKTALTMGAAAGAIMWGACAAPAIAAETPTSVDEVVVTANKRAEPLREVAMGVSALSGDALLDRQLTQFADYSVLVPGLTVQQGSPTFNRIVIRGLNAGGAGATVGLYVDDSPIGSSNALAQGSIFTSNIDTFDLQRVEVLRGPQGTLYGANTEGGLIKFVPNAPDPKGFSAMVRAGGETVSHGSTAGALKGFVNIPFGDRAALRVSAYYDELPGFIDDPYRGLKDLNTGRSEGLRVALLVNPTDNLSVKLTGFSQRLKSNGSSNVDIIGAAYSYASPPSNRFDPVNDDLSQTRLTSERTQNDLDNYSATIDWDLGPVTLTSITSYSEMRAERHGDSSGQTATFGLPVTPEAPAGTPYSYAYLLSALIYGVPTAANVGEDIGQDKFTQEIRLASKGAGPLQWQLGGFYTRETTSDLFSLHAIDVASGAYLQPAPGYQSIDARYEEESIFGQVTYAFTPTFDVAIGGRYSHNKQSVIEYSSGSFILGPEYSVSLGPIKEDSTTYSISPRWHVTPNTLVYARVASGYRPGGPNLVPPGAPADYPIAYGSDSTVNYEVGLRTELLDHKLTLDVAAFRIDWSKIQIPTQVGIYSVIGNGGSARSQGFEWAVGLRPTAGLNINFTGSYVDAKLTSDAALFGGVSGEALPYVPKWSSAIDAEYRWPVFGGSDAFVGATYAYVGKRYTDISTAFYLNPHTTVPSYSTLAARAGIDWKQLTFEVFAKNITDERGILGYSNSGELNLLNPAQPIVGMKNVIQPRTIGFALTARFD